MAWSDGRGGLLGVFPHDVEARHMRWGGGGVALVVHDGGVGIGVELNVI